MRSRTSVLARCVALAVTLLPGASLAGGRPAPPAPGVFRAHADFRPKNAFGSPGGFPLPIQDDRRAVVTPGKLARHGVVPRFPTTYFYWPTSFYAPPADMPAPSVTVEPVVYVAPTIYVTVPAAPSPTPPVAVAPPPPPGPTVVEYGTGRYELRGDGLATPYTWVWVPSPPAAPPAVRTDPPAAPAPSGDRTQIFRWTDDDGTEVWSNHRDGRAGRRPATAARTDAPPG